MNISGSSMTEEEFVQVEKALSRWNDEGGAHPDDERDISENPDDPDPDQAVKPTG